MVDIVDTANIGYFDKAVLYSVEVVEAVVVDIVKTAVFAKMPRTHRADSSTDVARVEVNCSLPRRCCLELLHRGSKGSSDWHAGGSHCYRCFHCPVLNRYCVHTDADGWQHYPAHVRRLTPADCCASGSTHQVA